MSQIERIAWIDRVLHEQGRITTREVSEHFEVSERQVKRDIEYLRWRLDAPVQYSSQTRSYMCSKPFEALRFANEKILLFYVMVRSLADNSTYLPVISRETLEHLEQSIGREYRTVSESIHYQLAVSDTINLEHFGLLCQAIKKGQVLHLSYINARNEASHRDIEICRLVNYMGHWYVVAWDREKQALRTFHMSRIQSLKLATGEATWLSGQTAERNRQLETYVGAGFGIFNGIQTIQATIRFHHPIIPIIRMQHWHPAQKDSEGHDNTGLAWLDRLIPVSDYAELLGRVLSFGQFAEVISPPDFRQRWVDSVLAMYQRLGDGGINESK